MSLFGKRFSDIVMSMAGVDDDSDSEHSVPGSFQQERDGSSAPTNPFLDDRDNGSLPNRSHRWNQETPLFEGTS